jgi:hypothetical protein
MRQSGHPAREEIRTDLNCMSCRSCWQRRRSALRSSQSGPRGSHGGLSQSVSLAPDLLPGAATEVSWSACPQARCCHRWPPSAALPSALPVLPRAFVSRKAHPLHGRSFQSATPHRAFRGHAAPSAPVIHRATRIHAMATLVPACWRHICDIHHGRSVNMGSGRGQRRMVYCRCLRTIISSDFTMAGSQLTVSHALPPAGDRSPCRWCFCERPRRTANVNAAAAPGDAPSIRALEASRARAVTWRSPGSGRLLAAALWAVPAHLASGCLSARRLTCTQARYSCSRYRVPRIQNPRTSLRPGAAARVVTRSPPPRRLE